ncbi:SagB/ThcOx family dehydrogenase [Sutterella sp.]|uniref:nitroreductase family protein n=1 Tax=Sutterella sp. TaxID=1981025 RepID=UPI0026E0A69E|nr:SagB/ThcOx family dehydrogenase [Sutterella sp.]MDO5532445.1 SagB/ThcOx family dehydrogenase [Sutterella sp.]
MPKTITLPAPKPLAMTVTDALAKRRSLRSFSTQPLSDQELANLLWAAAGITSPDGKRTAPSCLNLRAVTVFVLRADGSWRFDAEKNALEQTTPEDLRALSTMGQHQFVDTAPVTLVFVAEETPRTKMARPSWVYLDAGAMVQNAYIAATAMGFGGVARGSVPCADLGARMKLPATFAPIFCFTCGHPA